MDAGRALARLLPQVVAAPRSGRRSRAEHAPGASGNGVRGAGGPARDHRPVHDGPLPDRLRSVRSLSHPRARPGLLTRADDRGDAPADHRIRRRSRPCDRAGVDARPAGRCDRDRRGPGEARVHCRPAVQAHPDRLHERARADDPGRAAAEALRLLDRGERTDRRGAEVRQRARVGGRRGRRRCRGGGQPRADPDPPALAAPHPRRAGRGRRRDRRDLGARSLRPRGLARRDPARGAALPHLAEPGVRPPAPGCGSPRHRAGIPDRHDLHRFGVRGPNAARRSTATRR